MNSGRNTRIKWKRSKSQYFYYSCRLWVQMCYIHIYSYFLFGLLPSFLLIWVRIFLCALWIDFRIHFIKASISTRKTDRIFVSLRFSNAFKSSSVLWLNARTFVRFRYHFFLSPSFFLCSSSINLIVSFFSLSTPRSNRILMLTFAFAFEASTLFSISIRVCLGSFSFDSLFNMLSYLSVDMAMFVLFEFGSFPFFPCHRVAFQIKCVLNGNENGNGNGIWPEMIRALKIGHNIFFM